MDPLLPQLRQALAGDRDALAGRWIAETRDRCWQLKTDLNLADELRDRCEPVLSAFAETLVYSDHLQVGDQAFKEPMKRLSFVAGWMAGVDLPVSASLALCHGLQAALGEPAHPFFQQLEVVTCEAHVAGQREKAQTQHRRIIRKSQLVCMLDEGLAALLLVGDPDTEALQDAIGRLMMLSLMREVGTIVVDVTGVQALEAVLPRTLELLSSHRLGLDRNGIRLVLSGLAPDRVSSSATTSLALETFDDLEQCLKAYRSGGFAPRSASGARGPEGRGR